MRRISWSALARDHQSRRRRSPAARVGRRDHLVGGSYALAGRGRGDHRPWLLHCAINPIAGFSLFSNLVLCLIAITLLVRRRWSSVSFLALVGCYLAFGFWRVHTTGTLWVYPITDPSLFWTALLFPACYWLVFTVAVFLGQKPPLWPAAGRPS